MGSRRVYHYSDQPKLDVIDPNQYGKHKGASPEFKQGTAHMPPRSYVYDSPEGHEGNVTRRSPHRHEAYLPDDWKIYDIAQDPDKLFQHVQMKTGKVGPAIYDELEHEIKNRGFHGYKNSDSPLHNVVALFHPLKVHKPHPHPHAYDWHDDAELAMKKANEAHPHLQAHGPVQPNEQAGGVLQQTLGEHLPKFGKIVPNKQSNLNFYQHIGEHEPKIDEYIKNKGNSVYLAGGKYGKPDLANKNYKNNHLMIYDPSPQSGGDFGDESTTRAWRKAHEQAHHETYPEINRLYGEGRRMGRLGQRTPNEMKRAIHWEDKAVNKQRQIMKQLGYNISDEDFNKERNTVLTDALNRAISGKFSEPSQEGFEPHKHYVDLKDYLNVIDDHAKKLGLEHPHDTIEEARLRRKST